MKKYFQFTGFRKNLWFFIAILVLSLIVQCFGHGDWTVREIIQTDVILSITFVLASLVSDWIEPKNNDAKNTTGIKKYFQFIGFRKNLIPFMVTMAIIITGECHDSWTFSQIVHSNFIVIAAAILGSFISDCIQIKKEKVQE